MLLIGELYHSRKFELTKVPNVLKPHNCTSQVFLQVADNQEQFFYNILKIAKSPLLIRSIIMLCKINREVCLVLKKVDTKTVLIYENKTK
ncbi:MAG: hypothetical protein CVU13_09815 [Bacteroidetes bacterium HGW-Bacteroidetes-8]|nr:MAG: hypothetical protein CVU13_09815 [Bacteroidetes bacterium HGW-Bacteroidetes-8]